MEEGSVSQVSKLTDRIVIRQLKRQGATLPEPGQSPVLGVGVDLAAFKAGIESELTNEDVIDLLGDDFLSVKTELFNRLTASAVNALADGQEARLKGLSENDG